MRVQKFQISFWFSGRSGNCDQCDCHMFVSKRITTPISELTDISKRMTELDFDAKYVSKGHRKNEIDELGEHFNRLSCALESTISELKSANNELKQDIEKKTEIDEMRKEFLSNVSHELKTPLALIRVMQRDCRSVSMMMHRAVISTVK